MPYVLKFTTVANISRRLRGRLNVNNNLNTALINAASGTVDDNLILQVAEQIESNIELGLSQIYCMPVPQTATQSLRILGAIAEKLIISEIALTHFVMQTNPEMGADMGYGNALRKQAFEQMESILGGHGIYVPGIMGRPVNNPTVTETIQPLVLPGLKLIPSQERPDTYTRNYSCVETRTTPPVPDPPLWSIF